MYCVYVIMYVPLPNQIIIRIMKKQLRSSICCSSQFSTKHQAQVSNNVI